MASKRQNMFHKDKTQETKYADGILKANATSQLRLLMEQILHLQSQAYDVMENIRLSTELHHAACYFEKVPGKIYFLYRKPSGLKYFSMLSPDVSILFGMSGRIAGATRGLLWYDIVPKDQGSIPQEVSLGCKPDCPLDCIVPRLTARVRSNSACVDYQSAPSLDWRGSPPHEYIGAYKLENDMTWTPLSRIAERSRHDDLITRIIEANRDHNAQKDDSKPLASQCLIPSATFEGTLSRAKMATDELIFKGLVGLWEYSGRCEEYRLRRTNVRTKGLELEGLDSVNIRLSGWAPQLCTEGDLDSIFGRTFFNPIFNMDLLGSILNSMDKPPPISEKQRELMKS
ncbi:hypothetical protein AAG570_005008 [Ranatra chinensis]|uniref:Uncharacterized protein n=1 Tax=Ranatra chinensis TaxID=642074 RepID=A0ABD0XZ80_9HEMI